MRHPPIIIAVIGAALVTQCFPAKSNVICRYLCAIGKFCCWIEGEGYETAIVGREHFFGKQGIEGEGFVIIALEKAFENPLAQIARDIAAHGKRIETVEIAILGLHHFAALQGTFVSIRK